MRFLFVALLAYVVFANTSQAHEIKQAQIDIRLNDRSGVIELVHQFYVHDAEHAVKKIHGKAADVLEKPTQTAFVDYIQSNFSLMFNREPVSLALIGYETDGKYFWVYHEIENADRISGLKLSQTALLELWPQYQYLVSATFNDKRYSALLDKENTSAEFDGLN